MIEVWHKDSMAGNLLIGVSNMLLASVLSANKVQVLSQVRVKFKLFESTAQVFSRKKKKKKRKGGQRSDTFFSHLDSHC